MSESANSNINPNVGFPDLSIPNAFVLNPIPGQMGVSPGPIFFRPVTPNISPYPAPLLYPFNFYRPVSYAFQSQTIVPTNPNFDGNVSQSHYQVFNLNQNIVPYNRGTTPNASTSSEQIREKEAKKKLLFDMIGEAKKESIEHRKEKEKEAKRLSIKNQRKHKEKPSPLKSASYDIKKRKSGFDREKKHKDRILLAKIKYREALENLNVELRKAKTVRERSLTCPYDLAWTKPSGTKAEKTALWKYRRYKNSRKLVETTDSDESLKSTNRKAFKSIDPKTSSSSDREASSSDQEESSSSDREESTSSDQDESTSSDREVPTSIYRRPSTSTYRQASISTERHASSSTYRKASTSTHRQSSTSADRQTSTSVNRQASVSADRQASTSTYRKASIHTDRDTSTFTYRESSHSSNSLRSFDNVKTRDPSEAPCESESDGTNVYRIAHRSNGKLSYLPQISQFDLYFRGQPLASRDVLRHIRHAMDERLPYLVPKKGEFDSLSATVSNVLKALRHLKDSKGLSVSWKIDRFEPVGSLEMKTILSGHFKADIVVVLSTLPVKAAVVTFGNKLLEELQRHEPQYQFQIELCEDHLEITNNYNQDVIRILITTSVSNLKKLLFNVHIRRNAASRNLRAIEHTEWYKNVYSYRLTNYIRLLKDISKRFDGLRFITPWIIIVFCHYSMTYTRTRLNLPKEKSFVRLLRLVSGGIFLPYSRGITDPCITRMPINGKLSVYDQEEITREFQTILRLINFDEKCVRFVFGVDQHLKTMSDVIEYIRFKSNGKEFKVLRSVFSDEKLQEEYSKKILYGLLPAPSIEQIEQSNDPK